MLHSFRLIAAQLDDQRASSMRQKGPQPETNNTIWACISRLVNSKDGTQLPLDSLAAQAFIIFAAGYEPTALAITWAPFELAAASDLQVKSKLCTSNSENRLSFTRRLQFKLFTNSLPPDIFLVQQEQIQIVVRCSTNLGLLLAKLSCQLSVIHSDDETCCAVLRCAALCFAAATIPT